MPDNHALATTTHKGLAPKLSGSATQFLNGVGAYATPAGLAVGGAITGGTGGRVLFENGSNQLGEDSAFTWDEASNILTVLGFIQVNTVVVGTNTGWSIADSDGSNGLTIRYQTNLSGNRFLNLVTGDAETTLNLTGNHYIHTGTAPTISAGGGTGPSIVGRDETFTVTVGTGGLASSVEVTFATAFANAPQCVANHQGAILLLRCVSATNKVTIDAATPFTASGKIDVICRGYE